MWKLQGPVRHSTTLSAAKTGSAGDHFPGQLLSENGGTRGTPDVPPAWYPCTPDTMGMQCLRQSIKLDVTTN